MADRTITQLTATTSVVGADEIPLWVAGSGVTRKITRANFLSGYGALATANIWSAKQTYLAGITSINSNDGTDKFTLDSSGNSVAIPNTGVLSVTATNTLNGVLVLVDNQFGSTGMFLCGGNAVVLLGASIANVYSSTKNTASRINVYWEVNGVRVQNNLGIAIMVSPMTLRAT